MECEPGLSCPAMGSAELFIVILGKDGRRFPFGKSALKENLAGSAPPRASINPLCLRRRIVPRDEDLSRADVRLSPSDLPLLRHLRF